MTMSEGHGKIIVPLVVLALCAAAFVGVGYALDSTVQSNNNEITNQKLTIDLLKSVPNDTEGWNDVKSGENYSSDAVFNGIISTTNDKSGGTNNTNTISTSVAYLKAFSEGDAGNYSLSVEGSDLEEATIKFYSGTEDNYNTLFATANLVKGSMNVPVNTEGESCFMTGVVYKVTIESYTPTSTTGGFTLIFKATQTEPGP